MGKPKPRPRKPRPEAGPLETAADRIKLLLGWLNDEDPSDWPVGKVRSLLKDFVSSFDGSAGASYVRAVQNPWTRPAYMPRRPLPEGIPDIATFSEAEQQGILHEALRDILLRGFPLEPGYEPPASTDLQDLELAFGIDRRAPLPTAKTKEQRYWRSHPGAYVVQVAGDQFELVPFLLMHVLTAVGTVALTRCPAPAPDNWEKRCGRFVVSRKGPGRPPEFCEETRNACRGRAHAENIKESRR